MSLLVPRAGVNSLLRRSTAAHTEGSLNLLIDPADSRVHGLRWPAGEWGDKNDIKEYQIEQFMAFLDPLDAIPTISVRMVEGTPEAAAELVRYSNIEMITTSSTGASATSRRCTRADLMLILSIRSVSIENGGPLRKR